MKKGKDFILSSFEDKRTVIIVGLLCLSYLITHQLLNDKMVAKILPPWPFAYFLGFCAVVLIYQLTAWKFLKHFQKDWYKHSLVWVLFLCEYWLMLFAACFLSWPLYWIYAYFAAPPRTIY